MGWPIVVVASGGIPVTEAVNGLGTPVDIAANGFGFAVTVVAAGGMPVVGSGGGGPTYYVSAAGFDSNDGKTPATAWKTPARVNAQQFVAIAKTRVLFKGGDTFSGGLVFTPTNAPAGVSIDSYGVGQATISSGNSAAAVSTTNLGSVSVSNLVCTGGGLATNTTAGIVIQNTGAANLANVAVAGCTISQYGNDGILVLATNDFGFDNVALTGNTIHDVNGGVGTDDIAAIHVVDYAGTSFTTFTNVVASDNTIFNVAGNASAVGVSGFGIFVRNATGVTIERNLIHDTGSGDTQTGGGPAGIMPQNSKNIVIQFNVLYNCDTGAVDGQAISFDVNVSNCVAQYNYVFDCPPGAVLGYNGFGGSVADWGGNTFRFNIIVNCGDTNAAISFHNDGTAAQGSIDIYNNTIYCGTGQVGISSGAVADTTTALTASNNLFQFIGDPANPPQFIDIPSPTSHKFTGNNYFGNGDFNWGGSNYLTLAAFRTGSGQEKIGGVNVGASLEPRLVTYGAAPVLASYDPSALTQYQLQTGSPMIGAGIDITSVYGSDIGAHDYFGIPIVSSSKVIGAGQTVAWAGAASATSTQAAAFLARATGMDDAHQQQYNALISGVVADGNFARLVGLWKLATDTASHAALNLISTSFTLSISNSPTFTSDRGYTGNTAAGSIIDTTLVPSTAGGILTKSAFTMGGYDLTDGTSANDDNSIMGTEANNGVDNSIIAPMVDFTGTPSILAAVNDDNGSGGIFAVNSQNSGFYVINRTELSSETLYKNNVDLGTGAFTASNLPDLSIHLVGQNAPASDGGPSTSPDQCSYFFIGALTAADVSALTYRINADAIALGINKF